MNSKPLISIVILNYERLDYLKVLINSLREELIKLEHEIIVVDGGSSDGSMAWLTHQKDIISIIQHNHGEWNGKKVERQSLGYFLNLGFKSAKAKYICVLTADCMFVPNSIMNGYNLLEEKEASENNIAGAAFYFRAHPDFSKFYSNAAICNKVCVAYGIYVKQALESIGYIDEETYQFYFSDPDAALSMAQKGYHCIESPDSYVEHMNEADITCESKVLKMKVDFGGFYKKWVKVYPDLSEDFDVFFKTDFLAQTKPFDDKTNTAQKLINIRPFWQYQKKGLPFLNRLKRHIRYYVIKHK